MQENLNFWCKNSYRCYTSIYRCHAIPFSFCHELCFKLILSDLMSNFLYLRFSLLLRRHGSLLMVEEKCTSINWNWWSFRMVELTIKLTERQHVMPKGQCQTPLQRKTSWVTGIIGWYFDIWLLFQLSKGIRRYQEMRRFCCLLLDLGKLCQWKNPLCQLKLRKLY